jgi:hypothetical protein
MTLDSILVLCFHYSQQYILFYRSRAFFLLAIGSLLQSFVAFRSRCFVHNSGTLSCLLCSPHTHSHYCTSSSSSQAVSMRLVKVYKLSLALLLASPASCSPWRKARSRQEESNSAILNAYGTAYDATVSLSPSSLDTPLPLSDTPADLTPTHSEVLSRVHAWLEEAADPSSNFLIACTSDALRSWTDRCDSLAGSEIKQKRLAAMLTICQHESSSKLAVPTECRNWLDGRANVDECLECVLFIFIFTPIYYAELALIHFFGETAPSHALLNTGFPTPISRARSSIHVMPWPENRTFPSSSNYSIRWL